jgi:hypothetical protein
MGGIPATLIRYRFSEEEILFLEKLQWWNKDLNWIKKNKELFLDIQEFIEKTS